MYRHCELATRWGMDTYFADPYNHTTTVLHFRLEHGVWYCTRYEVCAETIFGVCVETILGSTRWSQGSLQVGCVQRRECVFVRVVARSLWRGGGGGGGGGEGGGGRGGGGGGGGGGVAVAAAVLATIGVVPADANGATPRYQLSQVLSAPTPAIADGGDGYTLTVRVNLAQTAVVDNDSLQGPVTFTEDLSGFPSGAALQSCSITQNGVSDNVASCHQSGPGANIFVSLPVTGAPFNGSYITEGTITLFVPKWSLSTFGGMFVSRFRDFAPVSPSGVANVAPTEASQSCGAVASVNRNPGCGYVTFPFTDLSFGPPAVPQYTLTTIMGLPTPATVDG